MTAATAAPLPPSEGPGPLQGEAVLNSIVAALGKYLALPAHAPDALALWVCHSYLLEVFHFSARLVFTSAVFRCGKSTALTLVSHLVHRPLVASSASAASIFRLMASERPTLLLDEADGWLVGDQTIRTILNGGFSRSTSNVVRVNTDTFQPVAFDAFGAMGLALIGEPDPTVLDRSIVIRMRRKTTRDRVCRLRGATIAAELGPIRERISAWADQIRSSLQHAEPNVPRELDDRASDLWEPLLAIADSAGGAWPERARTAAISLSAQRNRGAEDMRLRLLEDLRDVLTHLMGNRFPTRLLLRELVTIEGSPWSDWARGRALTSRGFADLLRPFGLTSVTIRCTDGSTPKGYKREDLEGLFDLYLDPVESATPPHDGS